MKTETGKLRWRKFVVSPALERMRKQCMAIGRGFGNRMTEIVNRYDALVAHYSPRDRFDDAEWNTLVETLRERWPQADLAATAPKHVSEVLAQAEQYELAERIDSMELAETTALIEEVYRDLIGAKPGRTNDV